MPDGLRETEALVDTRRCDIDSRVAAVLVLQSRLQHEDQDGWTDVQSRRGRAGRQRSQKAVGGHHVTLLVHRGRLRERVERRAYPVIVDAPLRLLDETPQSIITAAQEIVEALECAAAATDVVSVPWDPDPALLGFMLDYPVVYSSRSRVSGLMLDVVSMWERDTEVASEASGGPRTHAVATREPYVRFSVPTELRESNPRVEYALRTDVERLDALGIVVVVRRRVEYDASVTL